MYLPRPGDHVVIEDVQSGSHDVIGMAGTLVEVVGDEPDLFTVSVVFSPSRTVTVPATQVRPA